MLKSPAGITLLILGYLNYLIAIIYIATYRGLLQKIDESEAIVSGELVTPSLDGFKTLAYYDGFVVIGLGSVPALIGTINIIWRSFFSGLSGIWCAAWRLKRLRRK